MRKINLIKSGEIDKVKWDACIQNSVNRKVYAFSWYLDVVSSYKWDALVYGDYELVFPIVFKKILILKKIYHPFFCQQLGPFSSDLSLLNDDQLLPDILDYLDRNYRKFDFSINHHCASSTKKILHAYPKIQYIERVNLELDLARDYNSIYLNYNNNTKRNLKKSNHYNFQIKEIFDVGCFVSRYKKNVGYRSNLKNQHYHNMSSLIEICINKNKGFLVGLYDDLNNIVASAFFLSCFDREVLLFHVSHQNMKINIMTILIDKYISINSSKKKLLDFEGSSIPSIKRFYKGFGSVERNYIHIIK